MRAIIICTLLLLGAGCASEPLTPYERQDREIKRLEQFYADERSCKEQRGVILIKRRGYVPYNCRRSLCPPSRGEIYYCVDPRTLRLGRR